MVANSAKKFAAAAVALAALAVVGVVGLAQAQGSGGQSAGGGGIDGSPPPTYQAPAPPIRDGCAGRFCDEDGSVHQANIEQAAEWGITQGCEERRFCPGLSITRSQMAAFLYRAVTRQMGEPPEAPAVGLTDVAEGAWYRSFAQWAVSAEVIPAPDGEFDPGGVVTRGDMAEMLLAAFPVLEARPSSPGSKDGDSRGDVEDTAFLCVDCDGGAEAYFADLNRDAGVAQAAQVLYGAGITQGCSEEPLRFCPDRPVTRAQMASFFVRSLTTLSVTETDTVQLIQ